MCVDDLRGYCLRCVSDTHARVVRQLTRADHYGGIALGFVREVDADAATPAVGRGVTTYLLVRRIKVLPSRNCGRGPRENPLERTSQKAD